MYIKTTVTVPNDVNAQQLFNAIQRAINDVISTTQTQHTVNISAFVYNSNNEPVY